VLGPESLSPLPRRCPQYYQLGYVSHNMHLHVLDILPARQADRIHGKLKIGHTGMADGNADMAVMDVLWHFRRN